MRTINPMDIVGELISKYTQTPRSLNNVNKTKAELRDTIFWYSAGSKTVGSTGEYVTVQNGVWFGWILN